MHHRNAMKYKTGNRNNAEFDMHHCNKMKYKTGNADTEKLGMVTQWNTEEVIKHFRIWYASEQTNKKDTKMFGMVKQWNSKRVERRSIVRVGIAMKHRTGNKDNGILYGKWNTEHLIMVRQSLVW